MWNNKVRPEYYLGINWEQNSTAALFKGAELVNVISQERLSRVKNDERYPRDAIDWILSENRITKNDLAAVIFVSNEWDPSWILTRHYTSFSTTDYLKEQNELWRPNLYESKRVLAIDVFADKLDLEQYPGRDFWEDVIANYRSILENHNEYTLQQFGKHIREAVVTKHLGEVPIFFMDHSSCHTAYAYFSQANRKDKFLSISLDAYGDGINYSARIYDPDLEGRINCKEVVRGGDFIVGRLYRYITLILGLKPNEHEYKVMGLAPYCKPRYYKHLLSIFKEVQDVDGLQFRYLNRPKDHFFAFRELLYSERFDSIAGGLQAYTEYLIEKWVSNLIEFTGVQKLCYAGGVAMNVKANMVLSKLDAVETLHVPPNPDDASQAIGAVYQYLHEQGIGGGQISSFVSPYRGRRSCASIQSSDNSPCDREPLCAELINRGVDGEFRLIHENYIDEAAVALSKGAVLGVIWGREEFGARALGNRSIIASPCDPEVIKKINEKIKDRDFWMPFAASVLESHVDEYLQLDDEKKTYAFMTKTAVAKTKGRNALPAALHPYDATCRPHVVLRDSNSRYEMLINKFGELTGTFAILNTSLNLHGTPICSTIEDAVTVLISGELDGLLVDGCLCIRAET